MHSATSGSRSNLVSAPPPAATVLKFKAYLYLEYNLPSQDVFSLERANDLVTSSKCMTDAELKEFKRTRKCLVEFNSVRGIRLQKRGLTRKSHVHDMWIDFGQIRRVIVFESCPCTLVLGVTMLSEAVRNFYMLLLKSKEDASQLCDHVQKGKQNYEGNMRLHMNHYQLELERMQHKDEKLKEIEQVVQTMCKQLNCVGNNNNNNKAIDSEVNAKARTDIVQDTVDIPTNGVESTKMTRVSDKKLSEKNSTPSMQ